MRYWLLCLSLISSSVWAAAPVFQGHIEPIPLAVQKQMINNTWHKGCPVPLSDLAYIKMNYWGYDNQSHQGVMIVNRHLAKKVLAIFKQLYQTHFPIERMQPMYQFKGNDEAAMEVNNTSSFNCRPITGEKKKFSLHSYGRAIDINTKTNPYIKGSIILPINGEAYVDRSKSYVGKIDHNTRVYQLFKQAGWSWGGDWYRLKDYQHFEKSN